VRGDGNRPHDQGPRDRHCSPNIIWVIKWKQRAGRGVFTDWGKERYMQGFGGELEGKRPLGKRRHR
jgi:hypothetical protein